MTKLLIVESPAKAKTIAGYLGGGWVVRASYGHIRDLPGRKMGVHADRDFALDYVPLESKGNVIAALREAAGRADEIYLATDLDREGEAIAWHVAELLELPDDKRKRVTFSEITKSAITSAVAAPRELDHALVDAQQARRVVDRLVGYTLSPLLSEWMRGRLSAGRVQSAGLKVIADRERIIVNFVAQEYWAIKADLVKESDAAAGNFIATLTHIDGVKLEKLAIGSKDASTPIIKDLEAATYAVDTVDKDTTTQRPPGPFTTSSLQQEAARKLGLSSKATMAAAQELYQGIEIDGGTTGLITYMRTDSLNLSQDAINEITQYVSDTYAKEYRLSDPRTYTTKSKGAQEAHEAIRPTSILREPADLQGKLSKTQLDLYELIWKRTLATQLASATYDTMAVNVVAKGEHVYGLKASGRTLTFDGFLIVYEEGTDDEGGDDGSASMEDDALFPPLDDGESLDLQKIVGKKYKTKPPARFTEASFVKEMERLGIGRPSTYASIISVILDRGYVELKRKKFYTTEIGMLVVEALESHFPDIVDSGFTASMELDLDKVADGKLDWKEFLGAFWYPFEREVATQRGNVTEDSVLGKVEWPCPMCGKQLIKRIGKRGVFIACSGYPDCKYAVDPSAERSQEKCPVCGEGHLVKKKSKKTKYEFWSCERYPECSYIRGVDDVITERMCPKCSKGRVLRRKAKSGAEFFVCELRPECDWLEDPSVIKTDEVCPACGEGHLVQRDGEFGAYLHCDRRPECKYLRGVNDRILEDKKCPQCGARLCVKQGKHGEYTTCEMRPICGYIKRDLGTQTNETCPACGEGHLYLKDGQHGAYLYCERRPECKYLRGADDRILEDKKCPQCGARLCVKQGKYGEYTTCEMRPVCDYIKRDKGKSVAKATNIECPKCGKGHLMERTSSKGVFWGCSAYPKCKFTTNDEPLDVRCGDCGGLVVTTAAGAKCLACGKPA